jgi:maltose alpha-D-glucosyltransferase/alpha-amylase
VDVVADINAEPKLESDELWFKNAIIYQLHVKAFADSNNDGMP